MVSLLKPNVKIRKKNLQLAIYGHVLSLIGGIVATILGALSLLSLDFSGVIAILVGALVFAVEGDFLKLDILKDAMIRGIVWLILAVVVGIGGIFSGLLIIIGAILYLVYALL